MKTLIVTPWFPNRPGEQFGEYIYASVLALRRKGVELQVLVTRPWMPTFVPISSMSNARDRLCTKKFAPELAVSLSRYLSIPRNWLRPISNWLYVWSVARAIRKVYSEWPFEIIHAHTEMAALAALGSALEVPVVVTIHGINTARRLNAPAQNELVGKTLRACARVLLVGEPLRQHFGAIAGDTRNFRIVHNGFTWPFERSADRKIAFQKPRRFISACLLQEGKGIELTLRALALLNDEGLRDWRYSVIGDGVLMKELKTLATRLGLDEQVSFIGSVAHRDIYAYLAKADVFVLPSYREAFGVAYLEAMAAGLYVIGIAGQGPSAFIRSGENGLLIPPRDVPAIAEALRATMNDPDPGERAARQGRDDAFSRFTWDIHAERLLAEFRTVLK